MAAKTDTQVVIGGKMFTVSGYESEAYLQQVSTYLNNKLAEFGEIEGYNRQPIDIQNFLMQLNIADDLFKSKKQVELLEEQLEEKERELYDIKHELITTQMKLENMEESLMKLKDEADENEKKIIRLEAEAKSRK